MEEIICYTDPLPEGTKQNITFLELLLDDCWVSGRLECPRHLYSEIGNINNKLTAKQNYEFLLRAAKKYPVTAIGDTPRSDDISSDHELSAAQMDIDQGSQNASLRNATRNDTHRESPWDSYRTDCYIAGKYQQELLSSGYFNPVIETLLQESSQFPESQQATAWLEKMISHAAEYYGIDDNTLPRII